MTQDFFPFLSAFQCSLILSEPTVGGTHKHDKLDPVMMFVPLTAVLPYRASDLCEAAQQCSGAGRGECGVQLCCPRRPCSHCPLEER